MALLINWEVAPGALTNNRTTTLVAVVDDGTPLATQMGRHARPIGRQGGGAEERGHEERQ